MSCSSDPPSGSLREFGSRVAQQRGRGLAGLALAALLGGACTGSISPGTEQNGSGGSSNQNPGSGGSGKPGSGGSSNQPGSGGSNQPGSGGSNQPGGTGGSSGNGSGGSGGTVVTSKGGTTLRRLTRAEYMTSLQSLLGTITAQLSPPNDDLSVAGFVAVGASTLEVTDAAATAYEDVSLKATAEVFGDTQRWQKLVGCAPKADLSDACVTTYLKNFGRSAFRRDLTNDEVTQWLGVAKNAATLAGNAAQGLAAMTSGLLQSPYFVYRVETNKLDSSNGRLKYDGLSMATRLSFLLTGGPPSNDLLTAATSGKLDTADGVRTAVAPMLTGSGLTDRMTAFFSEYSQAELVLILNKSTTLFPSFTAAMKNSMVQGLQLFIKNVVLAANADVRSFYDSDQTFADANLAPLYGVKAPASGFAQFKLDASTGRAGILGQAAVIAGQSQSDRTSPTRRGVFILQSLLCTTAPNPPPGVNTDIPPDPTLNTRQRLEKHRQDATCANCHKLFDPMGIAMEHFDPIGRYREKEGDLAIDASGMILGGGSFDGEAQLGSALRQDSRTLPCMLRNFYRSANGRAEDDKDSQQIDALAKSLAAKNYAWNSFISDFVASDAFRSAPALPVTTGSP